MSTSNSNELNIFDASASMLGYFYQVRYALYVMLKFIKEGDLTKQVIIEGLDDIEVREDKETLQLLQTKHLTSEKRLTDSSKHFWKTIRIWSKHIKDGKINSDDTSLVFIINATPAEKSIIDLLSHNDKEREIDNILEKMNTFIEQSTNNDKTIQDCYEKFNQLDHPQKKKLLTSIKILALQSNIEQLLEKDIPNILIGRGVWTCHLDSFSKELDAWWFQTVVKQLSRDDEFKFISTEEINQQMNRLRDKYIEDAIKTEYSDADTVEEANNIPDDRLFITQLKEIGLSKFNQAKQTYYKAYHQRVKWIDNLTFNITELEKYEKKLISEWEHESEITDEGDNRKTGKKIYEKLSNKEMVIHKTVQDNYIMRGSYHILADKKPPQVYWHPKFLELLKSEDENVEMGR